MTAPHKICPRCQTPAPLEAAFCVQCGRQYRTNFGQAPPPVAPAPFTPEGPPVAVRPPSRAVVRVAQVGVALLVFLVVLLAAGVFRRGTSPAPVNMPAAVTPPVPTAPPETASSPTAPTSADPVTDEAQRVVERESQRLNLPPPSGSVSPDGRIHLKNGGSITKEEWEAASRRVHSSPLMGNPPTPTPPF